MLTQISTRGEGVCSAVSWAELIAQTAERRYFSVDLQRVLPPPRPSVIPRELFMPHQQHPAACTAQEQGRRYDFQRRLSLDLTRYVLRSST
jgi:hypothetical protein